MLSNSLDNLGFKFLKAIAAVRDPVKPVAVIALFETGGTSIWCADDGDVLEAYAKIGEAIKLRLEA